MFPDGHRRLECENDGGDVWDGRRTDGGNVEGLRSSFPEEVGNDSEPVIEGIRRWLQERRRREKYQQEDETREAEKRRQRQEGAAREGEEEQGHGKEVRFGKEEQSEKDASAGH